jgi:hypothetical protein
VVAFTLLIQKKQRGRHAPHNNFSCPCPSCLLKPCSLVSGAVDIANQLTQATVSARQAWLVPSAADNGNCLQPMPHGLNFPRKVKCFSLKRSEALWEGMGSL